MPDSYRDYSGSHNDEKQELIKQKKKNNSCFVIQRKHSGTILYGLTVSVLGNNE
jgi:hypothetical protein